MPRLPLSSVRTDPHWPLPTAARLDLAKPGPRMRDAFVEYHRGLTEIRIHVLRMRTKDGDVAGTEVQKLVLDTAPGDAPKLSADALAKIVWLRGERYARQHRKQTQFRVMLSIVDENGAKQSQQCRFMIKTAQLLADQADDDDGDGTDDDLAAELEEEEEDGDEEGEDEDDDEEYEEDDEDEDDEDEDYNSKRALVPLEERVDPSGDRHLVPQQINPAFFTAIIGETLKLAGRVYKGPMRENRIMARSIRMESINMVKANQDLAKMLLEKQVELGDKHSARQDKIIEHLQKRMETLEGVVEKTTNLSIRLYENFKELAREGWQAFHDAMKMKDEVVTDRIEWARWLVEDSERRQPPPPPLPPSREGGVADLIQKASESPVLLGGLSVILRKTGNERDAELLEKIAINLSRRGGSDDDEDEDDEAVDVDAHEQPRPEPPSSPGNGHAREAPTQAGPLGQRLRTFRASLEPKRLDALKKILPAPSWRAFEQACRAFDDRIVVSTLQTMAGGLDDNAVKMQIAAALTPAQVAEIMSIVEAVKAQRGPSREPPRRPSPRPSASE